MQRATPTSSGSLQMAEDGVVIYWDRFGRGDRETIVFLNGIAMLTESWYSSVPRVYPDYDVLLFDYPGQGRSSSEDRPYFIPRLGQYLARVLDHLDIERVHSVGVSYGGFVAADFGRQFPDRLHTQTLSGILLSQELSFDLYQDISLSFYAGGPELFDLYTKYMYEKTFGERFLRSIGPKIDKLRKKFYDNYKDRTRALTRLTEAQDSFFAMLEQNESGYRAVRAPTLIIAGEHDRVVPLWMQQKLVDLYPESRLEVLADCAHLTYLERPDRFWPLLHELLETRSIAVHDSPDAAMPVAS